jgi:molybdopterin molybdotransferase
MPSFPQARQTILESVSPLGVEQVNLVEAVGRVLAETVRAPWAMPLWDNSAMDGYAVRAADCSAVPCGLTVTGYLPAGSRADGVTVEPGCAIKIMTGAPLPAGADAVVPVEETDEASDDRVTIRGAVTEHQHIRFRGEDVSAGEVVLTAGTTIRPPEVGMLASMGMTLAPVYRCPVVAVLSTGDELVEPGRTPGPGEIINSNTLALAAAIRETGAIARIIGIARDNRESHREKLAEGLRADALVTSAGVSSGDRDMVRNVLEECGVRQIFWGVAMKPGKPTAFGMKDGVPVFSLPGNPVSGLITFEELVRPALLRMMGHRRVIRPLFRAVFRDGVTHRESDRTVFLRVRLEQEGDRLFASLSGSQQTGLLSTMVNAAAIAVIPPGRCHIAAGEEVDVHLYGSQSDLR